MAVDPDPAAAAVVPMTRLPTGAPARRIKPDTADPIVPPIGPGPMAGLPNRAAARGRRAALGTEPRRRTIRPDFNIQSNGCMRRRADQIGGGDKNRGRERREFDEVTQHERTLVCDALRADTYKTELEVP